MTYCIVAVLVLLVCACGVGYLYEKDVNSTSEYLRQSAKNNLPFYGFISFAISAFWPVTLPLAIIAGIAYFPFSYGRKFFTERNKNDAKNR